MINNICPNNCLIKFAFSFHVGSGCTNAVAFSSAVEAAREVFDTAEVLGFHMTLLDIGGGFPGQPDTGISFKEVREQVKKITSNYVKKNSLTYNYLYAFPSINIITLWSIPTSLLQY